MMRCVADGKTGILLTDLECDNIVPGPYNACIVAGVSGAPALI